MEKEITINFAPHLHEYLLIFKESGQVVRWELCNDSRAISKLVSEFYFPVKEVSALQ